MLSMMATVLGGGLDIIVVSEPVDGVTSPGTIVGASISVWNSTLHNNDAGEAAADSAGVCPFLFVLLALTRRLPPALTLAPCPSVGYGGTGGGGVLLSLFTSCVGCVKASTIELFDVTFTSNTAGWCAYPGTALPRFVVEGYVSGWVMVAHGAPLHGVCAVATSMCSGRRWRHRHRGPCGRAAPGSTWHLQSHRAHPVLALHPRLEHHVGAGPL
jgi:hypothetical protein